MNYYTFQPDLTASMPILKEALLITNSLNPYSIQELITQELLPGAFSMLGTKVRLILVTVMESNDITYWDLIFRVNADTKDLDLCHKIYENSIGLDDSYDHFEACGNDIYKIAFKIS